jgi:hypothetical protein
MIDDTTDYCAQIGQGITDQFAKLCIAVAGEAKLKGGNTSIATQIPQIEGAGADSIALATF